MKQIAVSIFLLISISKGFAQEFCTDDKDESVESFANNLGVPNCYRNEIFETLQDKSNKTLCDCKKNFEIKANRKVKPITNDEKRELAAEVLIKEYKKILINNLFQTVKMRAAHPTSSSYPASLKSCRAKSVEDFTTNCNSEFAKKFFKQSNVLNNLSEEMAGELARFISSDQGFKPKKSLLERSPNKCPLKETDALLALNSTLEESFTPKMIDSIKKLNPQNFSSSAEVFLALSEESEDLSEIYDSLNSHPLFAEKLKNPSSFINFFKSIPSPANSDALKATLYNKSNGDFFDASLAESCDISFNSLKNTVCSSDFENGSINIDPYRNFNKIEGSDFKGVDQDLSTSENHISLNEKILRYCENSPAGKINLSEKSQEISKILDVQYSNQSLSQFRIDMADRSFGNTASILCSFTSANCTSNRLMCEMIKKYESMQKSDGIDAKLAKSSNKEINTLLRSMLGDMSKLDTDTKSILINEGILPREDGTLVPQPDIQERKPDFLAKQAAQSPTIKSITSGSLASPQNSRSQASNEDSYQNDYATPSASYATTSHNDSITDPTNQVREQSDSLEKVQNEIRKRLSGMNSKPTSLSDAKKIARDASRSLNRQLTPAQEAALADSMMNSNPRSAFNQAGSSSAGSTASSPGMSDTDTLQQKWEKGRMNAALKDMSGAQKALAKDSPLAVASKDAAAPAEMTKVALNLADDPRVTLSENFNKKLDQNDPETQLIKVLLRSKNSFLLQVKAMNFKIVFNDKSGFNVLLESGDKKEAERIRPQLEMFLKKISTTSPLHNIFKT
jgi:hypothetical protein